MYLVGRIEEQLKFTVPVVIYLVDITQDLSVDLLFPQDPAGTIQQINIKPGILHKDFFFTGVVIDDKFWFDDSICFQLAFPDSLCLITHIRGIFKDDVVIGQVIFTGYLVGESLEFEQMVLFFQDLTDQVRAEVFFQKPG